ncbi:ADP-ribosylation factor-like protein 2-binding protein [Oopsacas minuta]|uniref:ADP-ribosylation factor-like protein 2-binding protein n=1 Tax=Oopsacas minuta TaxID=111878 RepID=A0AAV7JN20_9METZ|nr:ADP-ribosylation factor-like protein 2-binding protein [Oopsacas minuta]
MAAFLSSGSIEETCLTADNRNEAIADPCDIAIELCESDTLFSTVEDKARLEKNNINNSGDMSRDIGIYLSEEVFAHHISSGCDESLDKFNLAIGVIEDLLVSNKFSELQNKFFERYYTCFDYGEENKLNYMDIFQQYQSTVEGYIEQELLSQVPDFSMEWMFKMLSSQQDYVDMGIIEILNSFTDFLLFKELMLRYKGEKEGKGLDLSDLIMTSSLST